MRIQKRGFTILELLIVIGILSLLSVVILRTYSTVAQITFRLQQEKNVMQEVFAFSQLMQNISEKSTIDYSRYGNVLVDSHGVTDHLYLTGEAGHIEFFSTGNCLDQDAYVTGFSISSTGSCFLVMRDAGGKNIILNASGNVQYSRMMFKIVPFLSNSSIMSGDLGKESLFLHLQQPGFWVFVDAYSPYYAQDWMRNIHLSIQQFFTLK